MSDPTLLVAVQELKKTIHHAVDEAVVRFHAQTGLTPKRIEVQMIDSTSLRDPINYYMVREVRVTLGDF